MGFPRLQAREEVNRDERRPIHPLYPAAHLYHLLRGSPGFVQSDASTTTTTQARTARYSYTPAECAAALRRAADHLGESPSKAQYEDLGLTPASATIIRICDGWNAAKELAELQTTADRGSRVGPKPAHLDVSDAEWVAMSVDQRWHYRHHEENAQRSLDRRRRLRDWLDIYKASLGCTACGEADPACLDFHHVGPTERAVTDLATYGYSAADIHAELQHCEVRCANCHWPAHHAKPACLDSAGPTVRTDAAIGIIRPDETDLTKETYLRAWTPHYKQRRGCRECGETEGCCLQFHHPAPETKRDGVGRLISDSKPVEQVRAEVDRCVVLCANCHRQEHRPA
ncbi:homing endonuclease associated repeat-containing protein [Salinirubellus salinus]|uniref:homing endonuclease associated repeat-containing protein n=1 Tax=Salinirubellus salinus TaxID=1364945 RepID=UPI0036150B29